jgi:hypothetical protein
LARGTSDNAAHFLKYLVETKLGLPCGLTSPSSQVADTGGDNNGFEINPQDAFIDDSLFASNINGYALFETLSLSSKY